MQKELQRRNSLKRVKHLRDFFNAQDTKALGTAFRALEFPIDVDDETLETLFNRYFVGPMEPLAAPYASIYLDDPDVVMGKSTMLVRNLYETMGFVYPLKNSVPEDYIGIELDAYYQLVYLEEVKKVTYLSELRHYFLHEHLAQWIPKFCETIMGQRSEASNAIHFIILELKSLLIRETTTTRSS